MGIFTIPVSKIRDEIMKEFSQPVEATIFTWDGLKSVSTTPLDSVKHYLSMLNSGFVALENETGAIKAWIGDIDYRFFKFDYCNAARQVGSSFKPVVYLAALEHGLSPYEYYSGETKTYEEYDNWTAETAQYLVIHGGEQYDHSSRRFGWR
jgi:penicillin-binding protein 1A